MIAPLRQKRLYEEITAQLRKLVHNGAFCPGDRLPPERQLAHMFKVSRNSVREAIKSLEQQGVLVSKPGAGTFIAPTSQADLTTALGEAFARERHRLADIFELRLLLEPQIASLAAQRVTDQDLALLGNLMDAYAEALAQGQPVRRLDQEFHDAIAAATKNQSITLLMERMQGLLEESRDEALQSPDRNRESLEGHRRILDALCRTDPDDARTAMATHLIHTRGRVFNSNLEIEQ
ncbi:MAG: FadR family transcriptional regulator [Desulfovibrionales bacterium]|nr:FadR family transcriptional regulator [Desulfovibrionales bacterium]